VAVAEGPGDKLPFWPIAKPYQPRSIEWQPRLSGISGAVWVDADKDGERTSAGAYARRVLQHSKGNMATLVTELSAYDEAVAIQVAGMLLTGGQDLTSREFKKFLRRGSNETRRGFDTVIRESAAIKK
jgi:hypothetical protein